MGRQAVLALGGLLLLAATGCPEDWGPDGTNDRAMRKDLKERVEKECPEGKTREWFCAEPDDETSCRWICR
jgi:hypothetical protein